MREIQVWEKKAAKRERENAKREAHAESLVLRPSGKDVPPSAPSQGHEPERT